MISHLELVLVVFQSLHDHAHSFHGALQASIHTVEAIHAPRHVCQHPQTLWLLLWTPQLQARFHDCLEEILKPERVFFFFFKPEQLSC